MRSTSARKLTDQDVWDIWGKFHFLGMTLRVLAEQYEVDQSTVGRVIREESHRGVKRPDADEWRKGRV